MHLIQAFFIVLILPIASSIGLESYKHAVPGTPIQRGLAKKDVCSDISNAHISKGEYEEAMNEQKAIQASVQERYCYHGYNSDEGEYENDEEDDNSYSSKIVSIPPSMVISSNVKDRVNENVSLVKHQVKRYQDLDQENKNHVKEMYLDELDKQAKELILKHTVLQERYNELYVFDIETDLEYGKKINNLYSQSKTPQVLEIQAIEEYRMSRNAEYTKKKEQFEHELKRMVFQSLIAKLFIECTVSYTLSLFDVIGHDELEICLQELGYPDEPLWY